VSEVDNEVYETVPWERGGELVFVIKVVIIIAIADNHYPGFMHNIKQMNDARQQAIHFTRTAKNTYKDIEDRNYMEQISQTEEEKEAEEAEERRQAHWEHKLTILYARTRNVVTIALLKMNKTMS
jgi:hypothetical protein